jgi:hypothetical protein
MGSTFVAVYLFIFVLCGDWNTSSKREEEEGKKKKTPLLSLLLGCKFLLLGVMANLVCGSRNVMWWQAKLQRPSEKKKFGCFMIVLSE